MRLSFALLSVIAACSGAQSNVDPGLVGTWELMVPNPHGVARWVWEIKADGSYAFHAEGPGDVPSHSGRFEAKRGRYTLRATTLAWNDTGSYVLTRPDTMIATGRLGTASWHRVQLASALPPRDSATAVRATGDSGNANQPPCPPGATSPAAIYACLSTHPFASNSLSPPYSAPHSQPVDLDASSRSDGVIGEVRTTVQTAQGPGEIAFDVYRDRTSATNAFAANAVFDSKSFRQSPGEMTSTHAYTYRSRGEARCLSRVIVGTSKEATVTCSLLVQYPGQDPVIIVTTVREPRSPGTNEASMATVDRGNDLILAGLKEWEMRASEMLVGGAR